LFETKRIAAQAQKRSEEIQKQNETRKFYRILTSVFTISVLCISVFVYLFLANSMIPADGTTDINPMPVPLAAPHDNPITDGAYKCPICETEVENPN